MTRNSRTALLTFAVVLPASWLLAQQPSFPGNLDQLQEVLKRLQAEVKSLQETVKQLSREAKRNKNSTPSPVVSTATATPRPAFAWQKARDAYKRGLGLEEQRQFRAAMEAYSQAIEADPKSDAAFLHRGYCSYQLGDNPGAIIDFSQSLTIQPNHSRAYLARATAYAATGNNTNAMADVSEAILRDSRNPDSYLLRARLFQQKGEHQFAVRDYTSAAALAPNSEKSYLGRAIVYQADGQPQRALEECEQAVRANPNSSAGYLCRAEAYIKMNSPSRAVEEINRALVTSQALNQPVPLLDQVASQLAQSTPPSEKPLPVAAISPEPQAAEPVIVAAARLVPTAVAVPSAKAAIDAKRFHLLGREQNSQQQFEQALGLLNRAIELDPWMASAYNARGYAYLRLMNYGRAQTDFSEAIRLQPNYMNAYVNRAAARRRTGDQVGAVADQRKAAQLIAGDQPPPAVKSSLSAQR